MKLYKKSLGMILSSRLAYRTDFLFTFVSITLWSLSSTLFYFLIYAAGAEFPGWNFFEILVFLGVFNVLFGFANAFAFNFFQQVMQAVREGTLEVLLIKPVNEIYLFLSRSFEYESAGEILAGIALLVIGLLNTAVDINVILLFTYFVMSILFYFSAILFISSLAIRFIDVHRLIELLNHLFNIAEYPKNFFPLGGRILFSIIFPLFIFSYYPASAILGYEVENGLLIILSCIIIFFLALFFWKQTIKKYTGAGG